MKFKNKVFFLAFFLVIPFELFSKSTLQIEYLPSPKVKINALSTDKEGNLWIATSKGVHILNSENEYEQYYPAANEDEVYDLYLGVGGESINYFWVEGNKMIRVINDTEITRYPLFDSTSNIRRDQIQKVLVGDNQFLVLLTSGKVKIVHTKKKRSPLQEILKKFKKIRDITIDETGNKWILSGDGLYCISVEKNKVIQTTNITNGKKLYSRGNTILIDEKSFGRRYIWHGSYSDLFFKRWKRSKTNERISSLDWNYVNISSDETIWYVSKYIYLHSPSGETKSLDNLSGLNIFQKEVVSKDADGNDFIIGSNSRNLVKLIKKESAERVLFQGVEVEIDQKVEVKNLFFAINDTKILEQSKETLKELAQLMRSYPNLYLIVEGHTSKGVRPKVLMDISLGRANSVKKFLVTKGIELDRIETKGYGDTQLKDVRRPENNTNKRVEITIKRKGTFIKK